MIKSLSPYYLYIPFVSPLSGLTCSEYTLKLYVWNGDKTVTPATVSYQITKQNPTGSNADDKIDIARLINDFIIFKPTQGVTGLIDADNQYWVKSVVYYTTSNPLDYSPQSQETNLLLRGYNYGMDGENAQTPTNKILLSGIEFKVNRNGVFSLPIMIEQTPPPPVTFTIDSVNSVSEISYTATFTHPYIKSRYRLLGDTEWTNLTPSASSPVTVGFSFANNTEIQLSAFNQDTNELIFTDIFLYTI